MSGLAIIAVLIFILSLILVSFLGKKSLVKSANDVGGGNTLRSVVFVSAAIAIAITLLIKYVIL